MTKEDFKDLLDTIFAECHLLREAGQAEYAHQDNNAFANFERLSTLLELPREKILMVYLMKHLDGIAAFVNGHRSQRESVKGRINDAIVYLALLRGMVDWNTKLNATNGGSAE